jgi:hypothetical protein
MWQPNKAQWRIIWVVAVLIVLGWPSDQGRSLLVKAANWLVDPANSLPTLPGPLPIGLDDNGDVVAEHDAQETEYYRQYASSPITRLRMRLKDASDPLDPSTERQLLAGVAILSALAVWRLNSKTA